MDKLFGSLKGLVKIQGTVIDNNAFRLHYKVTVPMLIAFSVLVTSRQYIGDPIDCISKDDFPIKLLDSYCWIHTTFSVEDAWFKKVGVEVPYPGVDSYKKGEKRVYHAYYQWVCFVLFLQAVLFYLPRYFWKSFENGRIRCLILELNSPILTQEKRRSNRNLLVRYFVANLNHHNFFAFCYFVCEVMNVVNVIGQMYLMDTFLGDGAFTNYGIDVVRFSTLDQENRSDPLVRVFPRMTKCTFHRFGSSGDIQKYDALCLLPLNVFNEKIYIFLWFWLLYLSIVSSLVLFYRLVLIASPRVRYVVLKSRSRLFKKTSLATVMSHAHFGDWFVLNLLCKNIDSVHYEEIINELAKQLTEGDKASLEKSKLLNEQSE